MEAEVVIDRGVLVHVRLSERNLLTLLTKLYDGESKRTIFRDTAGARVIVEAESDARHYDGGDSSREAGLTHPRTEAVLTAIKEKMV